MFALLFPPGSARVRVLCSIYLSLAVPVHGQNLPELGDSSQGAFSTTQERSIGQEIMEKVRADRTYFDDIEVTDYVGALGAKLAASSGEPGRELEFFVMRDSTLNAFALPGGYVGVHTGLILAAENESELAAVLAHEIAHITQRHIARMVAGGNQSTLTTLAALAVAILAARSNSQVAEAAIATAQATAIQSQLDYTREHEREADRIGLQTLALSGFDARAMASFFDKLQRSNRAYDTSAPKYLRTHPVTTERIADVQNRLENLPYRQVRDRLDFRLVRARLRALMGTPKEAGKLFEADAPDSSPESAAAHVYGRALALWRQREFAKADAQIALARKVSHPMIESLAAQIKLDAGQLDAALKQQGAALQSFPGARALVYSYAEGLIAAKRAGEALKLVNDNLQLRQGDHRLYELQAKAHAALGQRSRQHRSQAEAYVRRGNLPAAIEQLQLALRTGDGDYYDNSSAEARLRELQVQYKAERKAKSAGQPRLHAGHR